MTANSTRKRKSASSIIKSPYFESKVNQISSFEMCRPKPALFKLTTSRPMLEDTPRLDSSFFNQPCVDLAKQLLGKILVRDLNGVLLKGRIVETESYLGGDDKASISYGGKVTEKSKPMYMQPGTTFVYLTYGMYNLINISSQGDGAAVLLRALEPIEGITEMEINRNNFQPNKNKPKKDKKAIPVFNLCNGPAKLCISLNIKKETCNMQDLSTWTEMWIENGDVILEEQIIKSRRIGIDSAGAEWANKLLRFYVINNKSVSKRDKSQELLLINNIGAQHHNIF